MKKFFTLMFALLSVCLGYTAHAQYCTPGSSNCAETINNVTFNTINNTSANCPPAPGYTNFSGISTTVIAGQSYSLSVTVGSAFLGDTVYVWADYNHNFVFDNTELVATLPVTAAGTSNTVTTSITIPANATTGSTILRTRVMYQQNIGACGTANYGEAEDYSLNILLPLCTGAPAAETITTAPQTGHLCYGATMTLNAVDNNNATGISYRWQQSPTGAAGSFTNVTGGNGANTLSYTTPALFTTTYYRIVDSCSASQSTTPSAVYAVTVSPSVIGTQPANANVCLFSGASFSITPNGTGLTYQWQVDTGGGFTNLTNTANYSGVTTSTLNITVVSAGMSGYRYRVIVNGGCQPNLASSAATLTVILTAKITTARPLTFCTGDSAILNANTGTGYAYQYYQNGTLIASTPTFTARSSGTYMLLVIANGCTASDSVTIVAKPTPAVAVVTLGSSSTFCFGNAVLLSTAYNAAYTYQWFVNNATILGANSYTYSATDSGVYTLHVVGANGCYSASVPVKLTAINIPDPLVDNTNGTFCSVNQYAHFQWYLKGNIIPGATSNCYTPVANGTYYLQVSDTNSCSKYSTSYLVSNVGITSVTTGTNSINVYPNPATSFISIHAPYTVNIKIAAADGRVILSRDNAVNIDLSSFATGMYIISIYNNSNVLLKVEKLVKQ